MKKIAIITPYTRCFISYCKDNNLDQTQCVMVNRIEHVRGVEFLEVIEGYRCGLVDPDVIEQAKLRIR